MENYTAKTHFGFETIDAQEKQSRVRDVFDSVASRYDLMNDVMSGGLHRLWKKELVAELNPQSGMKILDVAGGTGDITFRMAQAIRKNVENTKNTNDTNNNASNDTSNDTNIVVCDINQSMLREGRNRAIDRNMLNIPQNSQPQSAAISWICGNAESLPFPDDYFDAYTIAFGVRNVTDINKALSEALRVIKIGGRFLCLEFSPLGNSPLTGIYDAYSFKIIPLLGELITKERASYQYLVESIRRFPDKESFAQMIKKSGFGNVHFRSLNFGVVAIHSGRKL